MRQITLTLICPTRACRLRPQGPNLRQHRRRPRHAVDQHTARRLIVATRATAHLAGWFPAFSSSSSFCAAARTSRARSSLLIFCFAAQICASLTEASDNPCPMADHRFPAQSSTVISAQAPRPKMPATISAAEAICLHIASPSQPIAFAHPRSVIPLPNEEATAASCAGQTKLLPPAASRSGPWPEGGKRVLGIDGAGRAIDHARTALRQPSTRSVARKERSAFRDRCCALRRGPALRCATCGLRGTKAKLPL